MSDRSDGDPVGPDEARHVEARTREVVEDDPNRPTTEGVREHLASLAGIAERPVAEHADLYAQVHASLQSALTSIDDATG